MPAHCPRFDLPLDEVVVDRHRPVFEVPRQCVPAVQAVVVDCPRDRSAVRHAATFELQPDVQLLPLLGVNYPELCIAASELLLVLTRCLT